MPQVLCEIHPHKGDLRMDIDVDQDIARCSGHVSYDGIERYQIWALRRRRMRNSSMQEDLPLPRTVRSAALLFERGEIEEIVFPLPLVETLATDSEMAADQSRIPAVRPIEVYPSAISLPLYLGWKAVLAHRRPAGNGRCGHIAPSIPRFTPINEFFEYIIWQHRSVTDASHLFVGV